MRPSLLVANADVPFHGDEDIAATLPRRRPVITTTARSAAIELTAEWTEKGRLPRTPYVAPWAIVTLDEWTRPEQLAATTRATVDDVCHELERDL